ncbi:hypothetical protein FRB99_005304 [Tulasnella sp. 403]|nr:hypothetical protein FRB99_005304 [Tulasnella sp. 403]
MPPSVEYHCTCTSSSTSSNIPPEPSLPSSSYAFHPLHKLYFCEECDLVRCNRCVSVEVCGYYCPNCLFEVPSASVRAEKNRCARNCFQCPHCRNTLSVVPSDPPESELDKPRPPPPTPGGAQPDSIGEPPFFLYCNYCRWDSAEVGITFEKPTGLALQLQRLEDSLPDSIEFDRLKDHFEPLLLRSSSSSAIHATSTTTTPHHHNPITAAASSALARDIPGLRTGPRRSYSSGKTPPQQKSLKRGRDEWESALYKSRLEAASGGGMRLESEMEWIKSLNEVYGIEQVSDVEQRWSSSWVQSMKASELQPLRIPLHSKKTKRCPACRHILIKPEQKAQSVRYKIKLMAANYLPSIDVVVPSLVPPPPQTPITQTKSKIKSADDDANASMPLLPGKSYAFHMSFMNPLYEPIQIRLAVHRAPPALTSAPRPSFAVTLPSTAFPISAFTDAWEYEDDDDMFDEDDLEEMLSGTSGSGTGSGFGRKSKSGKANVGVLERKANVTKVGGEVLISREGSGDVKFNMQVSYTYRADDPSTMTDDTKKSPSKADPNTTTGEMKTFTFFTLVNLGTIAPRTESSSNIRRDVPPTPH